MTKYRDLGVSTQKKSVEAAFGKSIHTDFPYAFCNLIYDPLNSRYVLTLKNDGSGSKPVIRIIYYLETGKKAIFRGDAFDVYAMCAGDAAASGLVEYHVFTDTIDINGFNVPKDIILEQLEKGFREVMNLHRKHGFDVSFLGGETADLPIQTKSYVLNGSLIARSGSPFAIQGKTEPGDVIFGLASDGKATWEKDNNSGIMSNGLTLGGNVLLHPIYNKLYPHLKHPQKPYQGRFRVTDKPDELYGISVGEAILSPTRQWAIVIRLIIDKLMGYNALHLLHGITMNTGGAATKILRLGQNIHYIKNMPIPPDIFQLIQKEGNVTWREMFEDFNCGVGVDLVGSPEKGGILRSVISEVASEIGIRYYYLGKCTKSSLKKNSLSLETEQENFFFKGK